MTSPDLHSPAVRDERDAPPPSRLTRSREDRVIAGVAGGLGRYFSIDPVIVRIAFVVLALAGGSGVLAYVIAWVAIPEASHEERPPTPATTGSSRTLGIVLVALGAVLLVDRLVPAFTWFSWRYVAPVALVAIGLLLITRREVPR